MMRCYQLNINIFDDFGKHFGKVFIRLWNISVEYYKFMWYRGCNSQMEKGRTYGRQNGLER